MKHVNRTPSRFPFGVSLDSLALRGDYVARAWITALPFVCDLLTLSVQEAQVPRGRA